MPRLKEPEIRYMPEGEAFTWNSRNMPVFPNCENDYGGQVFCVSHKLLLNDLQWKMHREEKTIHVVVWYCAKHELMEEM